MTRYPGPWMAMHHGPECTAYDANGVLVAEIGDGKEGREDLQRLILAAPELLEALKRMVAVDDRPFGRALITHTADGARRVEHDPKLVAEALIARIEGR